MEKLLIIEHKQNVREQLRSGLCQEYTVFAGGDRIEAVNLFVTHAPKVVVLDLGLPPEAKVCSEGFRCLDALIARRAATKIIVLTDSKERETAYRALACGAYDFYEKPVDLTGLTIIIRRAFHLCSIEEQGRRLQEALEQSAAGDDGIAGECAAMRDLLTPLQDVEVKLHLDASEDGEDDEASMNGSDRAEGDASITAGHFTLREVRDRVEKSMIHAAVDNCGGNMAKASELLGVSRPALYDLMKKHGLFKGVRN